MFITSLLRFILFFLFSFDLTNVKEGSVEFSHEPTKKKTLVSMTPHYCYTNELMNGDKQETTQLCLYVLMVYTFFHPYKAKYG